MEGGRKGRPATPEGCSKTEDGTLLCGVLQGSVRDHALDHRGQESGHGGQQRGYGGHGGHGHGAG